MNNQEILNALASLEQPNRNPSFIDRILRREPAPLMDKALISSMRDQIIAAEQGTVVNATLDAMGWYNTFNGVREKDNTEATFEYMRNIAKNCEVISAIINKRIQQVAAFCQLPTTRHGYNQTPGFKIVMRKPEEPATPEDRERMTELERFIMETGWCDPPEDERPRNWEPGFEPFIRQIVNDSLTLDWVAVRRWPSRKDPERFPITCFTAIDAAKIRKVSKPATRLVDGVQKHGPWLDGRVNTREPRIYAKVGSSEYGQIVETYTASELFTGVRNPRTNEESNGYGYCELERALNAAMIWMHSRDYNASRFRIDNLPRGFLTLFGNINQQQFDMFRLSWKQMMEGANKRWGIPMVRGLPGQGSQGQWTPMDLSSRDMEYHQFMFTVSLWCHSLYGIHPDETGLEGLNPNRPPLSQASPQAKLEYSQDSGLTPLLKWVENLINREIIWRMIPDRRYIFKWVGTGQYDEVQDIQMKLMLLQGGFSTPRMIWAEMDIPIPEAMRDHPAWDLPMPIAEGMQYVDQLRQASMQEQQAQQQQQSQAMDSSMKDKMDQAKMMQQAGGMPGGGGQMQPPDAGGDQQPPMMNSPMPGQPQQVPQVPQNVQKSLSSNRYSAFSEAKPIIIEWNKKK